MDGNWLGGGFLVAGLGVGVIMSEQTEMFPLYPDYPGFQPRETSQQAAAEIAPKLGKLQDAVLTFIEASGRYGATDDEIRIGLGLGHNTARPRRCELLAKGLVFDSGKRRLTESGRQAAVWVAHDLLRR